MAYIPKKCTIELRNPNLNEYEAVFYNPQTNAYSDGNLLLKGNKITIKQEREGDWVLILDARK
jgi:hypothetical protein